MDNSAVIPEYQVIKPELSGFHCHVRCPRIRTIGFWRTRRDGALPYLPQMYIWENQVGIRH